MYMTDKNDKYGVKDNLKAIYGNDQASDLYETVEALGVASAPDNSVDHPSHYTFGRFETIEMIEEISKGYKDGYLGHCAGTAVKYLSRAPFKHESPLEDIKKAAKYLEFAIEYLEKNESDSI